MKICDFCSSNELDYVYQVPESPLGVHVCVCRQCGLTQSVQTKEKPSERIVSTSSGASWGNIRHGKSLRFQAAVKLLEADIPWQDIENALDIGSNRGDFVQWMHASRPHVRITAVEPDAAVVNEYRHLQGIELQLTRFEAAQLPDETFDFVYSSHTLEHADSASAMLTRTHQVLRSSGWMYLEIPNLEFISDPHIVEEFFIDKHAYHFDRISLCHQLERSGFEVVRGRENADRNNITLLVKKTNERCVIEHDATLADRNRCLIESYAKRLAANRQRLSGIAEKLYQFMGRQKVVLWGAGRIFDALVRYGSLKTDRLSGLVDSYLAKLVPTVHGVPVQKPDFLRLAQPDVVIVLARSSTDEIVKSARRFGIRHVMTFSDLLIAS